MYPSRSLQGLYWPVECGTCLPIRATSEPGDGGMSWRNKNIFFNHPLRINVLHHQCPYCLVCQPCGKFQRVDSLFADKVCSHPGLQVWTSFCHWDDQPWYPWYQVFQKKEVKRMHHFSQVPDRFTVTQTTNALLLVCPDKMFGGYPIGPDCSLFQGNPISFVGQLWGEPMSCYGPPPQDERAQSAPVCLAHW